MLSRNTVVVSMGIKASGLIPVTRNRGCPAVVVNDAGTSKVASPSSLSTGSPQAGSAADDESVA